MKINRLFGFTLIELLIVIVILGLLMSLVAPQMFSKVRSNKAKVAAVQMDMIATALNTYRLDVGNYPATLNELRRSTHTKWDGPYLPRDIPLDPWDNPYVYSVPGNDGQPFTLMSYGRDGVAGGTGEDEDVIYK